MFRVTSHTQSLNSIRPQLSDQELSMSLPKIRRKGHNSGSRKMEIREKEFVQSEIFQKPERPSIKDLIFSCIRKYFDATSLHGFKYLSEPNRPLYERIYWLLAIILVYAAVACVIIDQVMIYIKKPVLITFDSKSRSIEEIPFPAVTICPDNQIRTSVINLTDAFRDVHLLSPETRKRLEYAVYICHFNSLTDSLESFEPEFIHDMLDAVFGFENCNKLIYKMEWLSVPVERPCRYFQPMVARQGACFTFNMMPFSYIYRDPTIINWAGDYWEDMKVWSPDTGFVEGAGIYPGVPPWRPVGGNMAYFRLNIEEEDNEEICRRGGKGFSVYIHNPAEMPSSPHPLVYIEENRDTSVTVSPQLYRTDESLVTWTASERGCYFQTEKYLSYFQIYTLNNCELECKANATLDICKCAPHHFPRKPNTPVCGPMNCRCIETAAANSSCDCLPSCSELQYEIRTNKTPRNLSQDITHQTNGTYTMLKVMFQRNNFIGIKRTVMFGPSDFIANVGGLLGLFLGFSILSLVEIIYFLLFRPCTTLARKRKRMKTLKINITTSDGSSLSNLFHPSTMNNQVISIRNRH